jgi:hypothetical protein
VNFSLDLVKPEHELLVATDPVSDRLGERRVTRCLLLTFGELGLDVLLALVCEHAAIVDAFAAHLEALVDVGQRSFRIVEAVLTAAGALVVHVIELLVQESIVDDLTLSQTLEHGLKHLVVHVLEHTLIFRDLKKLAQFFWGLVFRVKVHLSLLLQFLPVFKLFLLPVHLILVFFFQAGPVEFHVCLLEHCWAL